MRGSVQVISVMLLVLNQLCSNLASAVEENVSSRPPHWFLVLPAFQLLAYNFLSFFLLWFKVSDVKKSPVFLSSIERSDARFDPHFVPNWGKIVRISKTVQRHNWLLLQ